MQVLQVLEPNKNIRSIFGKNRWTQVHFGNLTTHIAIVHSKNFMKTGLRVSKQNSKKDLTVCGACTFSLYIKNVFYDKLLNSMYSFFGLVTYFNFLCSWFSELWKLFPRCDEVKFTKLLCKFRKKGCVF